MTTIEWTDETWNPIVGCSKVSPGCANCYAAKAAKSPLLQRFPQYQVVSEWDGTTQFVKSQLLKPLSWRSPKKIFVCSMSDLFHENTTFGYIDKVFAVMAVAKQHTFQVLTKRPKRMMEYFSYPNLNSCIDHQIYQITGKIRKIKLPLPNVWLGVTTENQQMANKRIPLLLRIPATVRFLSCEPLLGPLNLGKFWEGIHWVIVGGESGPKHRPMQIEWAEHIREQCQTAGVPFFFKQVGGKTPKAGGRLLDGRTWEEMPAQR